MSTEHDEHSAHEGRRSFVLGTLGLGGGMLLSAAAGCREAAPPPTPDSEPAEQPAPVEAPALPDNKDLANFIKHGDNPLTLETRREKLGTSVLTATSVLFVRQNLNARATAANTTSTGRAARGGAWARPAA